VPRIGGDILGVPAVHAVAGVDLRLAERLPARVAIAAVSAGETEPRDHDPVAHADLLPGAGSERLDDSDALVARDQWQRRLDRPVAVRCVDVGVAEAAGLDPDEHLAVARLGPGDVLDAERLGEVMNHGSFHGGSSL